MSKGDSKGGDCIRQCAVTRMRRPSHELIRFVVDPEGAIVPDLKQTLPGRGLWLTCTHSTIERAVALGVFAREFRSQLKIDADLPERLAELLAKVALQRLALGKKSGQIVTGFHAVEAALLKENIALLIHATEAAEGGCRKLNRLIDRPPLSRQKNPPQPEIECPEPEALKTVRIVTCFTSHELSLAFGHAHVIHAAMGRDGGHQKLLLAIGRLESYRRGHEAYAAA